MRLVEVEREIRQKIKKEKDNILKESVKKKKLKNYLILQMKVFTSCSLFP